MENKSWLHSLGAATQMARSPHPSTLLDLGTNGKDVLVVGVHGLQFSVLSLIYKKTDLQILI